MVQEEEEHGEGRGGGKEAEPGALLYHAVDRAAAPPRRRGGHELIELIALLFDNISLKLELSFLSIVKREVDREHRFPSDIVSNTSLAWRQALYIRFETLYPRRKYVVYDL
jgi:hypothetical protein